MPVVYKAYPTAEPALQGLPGETVEGASPAAFGAATGAALSHLGSAFGDAGDKLERVALERQALFNQIASDEQINNWQDAANTLMYGNSAEDTGFRGKLGRAAMDAFPDFRKNLEKLTEERRGTLQNDMQRRQFDHTVRSARMGLLSEAGRHYDTQFKDYGVSVAKGSQTLAQQGMSRASADGNYEAAQTYLGKAMVAAGDVLRKQGRSEEEAKAAEQAEGGKFVHIWGESLGEKDPEGALAFLEKNKGLVAGDEYNRLQEKFRSRANEARANRVLYGDNQGERGSSGQLVRGGASQTAQGNEAYDYLISIGASPNKATLLTAAAQVESGFNPEAKHDEAALAKKGLPPGYGMFGHNDTRLVAMQQRFGPRPTWQQQLQFALDELNTRPEGSEVDSAKTPEELTALQERFEGPVKTAEGTAKRLAATKAYLTRGQTTTATPVSIEMKPNTFLAPGAPAQAPSTPTSAPAATPDASGEKITQVGDSLTSHLITFGGGAGRTDRTKVGNYRENDTAVSGFTPEEIRYMVLPKLPPELVKGKPVNLSTGISNSKPDKIELALTETIPAQIAELQKQGAKSINLMGVGTHPKLAGVNDRLAQIAKDAGITFSGPIDPVAGDQIHFGEKGAKAEMAKVQQALGGTQAAPPPGAPAAPKAADTLVGIPPPEPGQLPDAQIPGLLDKMQAVMKNPEVKNDPAFREYIFKKMRRDANLMWSEQQHARQSDKVAQAELDQKIMKDLQLRMAPGHPNPVTKEELFDPRLSPEAQRTVVGFYERETKPQPESHLSAQTLRELYTKQQDGTLKGEKEINDAYIWGYLSDTDHKKAVATYRESEGEREKDWNKAFDSTLKLVEPRIFPALAFDTRQNANLYDKTGAERVLQWKQAVEAKKEELRKAGKNPMVLLQVPTESQPNPDYVGSEGFWKGAAGEPPPEVYNTSPTGKPKVAPPPIDTSSLAGLQKAARDYPERREEFMRIAVERGFVKASPVAPVGSVPIRGGKEDQPKEAR